MKAVPLSDLPRSCHLPEMLSVAFGRRRRRRLQLEQLGGAAFGEKARVLGLLLRQGIEREGAVFNARMILMPTGSGPCVGTPL